MLADEHGTFKADSIVLRGEALPYFDATIQQIETWLAELVAANLIALFDVDDRKYGTVVNWLKFNTPRSANRKYPEPFANISRANDREMFARDFKGSSEHRLTIGNHLQTSREQMIPNSNLNLNANTTPLTPSTTPAPAILDQTGTKPIRRSKQLPLDAVKEFSDKAIWDRVATFRSYVLLFSAPGTNSCEAPNTWRRIKHSWYKTLAAHQSEWTNMFNELEFAFANDFIIDRPATFFAKRDRIRAIMNKKTRDPPQYDAKIVDKLALDDLKKSQEIE